MSQQRSTSSSCSSSSRCSAAACERLLTPRRFRLGVILLHSELRRRLLDVLWGCRSNLRQLAQISNHFQLTFLKNFYFYFLLALCSALVNPNSCAPAKAFPNFLVSFSIFLILVYFFIDSLTPCCQGQPRLPRVYFCFDFGYWRFPILDATLTAQIAAN